MLSTERRRAPRAQILGQLHGRMVTLDAEVRIREISLGGMSLESDIPFPVGAIHQFNLFLGDGARVAVSAQVKHSRLLEPQAHPKYLTGFQFVDDGQAAGGPGVSDLVHDLT